MSYIEKEALIEWLELVDGCIADGTVEAPTLYKQIITDIKNFGAADVVEIRHAYWKETTHITESKRGREIHSKLYNCSNCDAPNGRKKSSYCHWCGAKMDGERREE